MEVREIIDELDHIAEANHYELYVKATLKNDDNRLKIVFFSPVTGKSKYLLIEPDKFCYETLSHVCMLLMEKTTPRYVKYFDNEPVVIPELKMAALYPKKLVITKVIFNDPATIVFWSDGTKTVVKAQNGEVFDPEKGLSMAISKKFLCNNSKYYE